MTTAKEHNDEVVRKLTEKNKVAEFAMSALKMDERRADVFAKACGDYFTWDGTLKFKGAGGEVAADDPACKGFFEREYDFLLPTPKAKEQNGADIPAEMIAAAITNMTVRSQVFKKLHGDKPKSAEGDTRADLEKLLAGERAKGGTNNGNSGGKVKGDNPWSAEHWNLTKQGSVAKSDLGLAQRLAKAAGSFIGATRPAKAA